MTAPAVALLYRDRCGKCRAFSRALVVLSLGWLRRVPLSSEEARALAAEHGIERGKLALVGFGRTFTAWRVVPGTAVLAAAGLRARTTNRRPPPAPPRRSGLQRWLAVADRRVR